MRMRILSQDLSLRSFLTIGPYERDPDYKELLRSVTQKGLLIYGLLGAFLVLFHVGSHVLLDKKEMVWNFARPITEAHILMVDKILIFVFSSIFVFLSRSSLSLKWIRSSVFILIWFTCIAMLLEDIARQDPSFTSGYLTLALLFAVLMVPYKGWQTALLSITVIFSSMLALAYLPGLMAMGALQLDLSHSIYIAAVAVLLTGTSSLIYINRYEQFRARKRAEELSELLEERAQVFKMLKEKSEKQAEKIMEHEKLKDRFFANISHELRTPLTLILGPLRDLVGGNNQESQKNVSRETLRLMRSNADRLLEMINQLLDLSKIEAHEIQLQMQEVDVSEFITEKVLAFSPLAESQNVELNCYCEDELLEAEIDPGQMELVINNLVSNAIKFTPGGGTVRVSLGRNSDTGKSIEIRIADSGIGIPEDELPHIFDRFYQAPHNGKQRTRGTGIGLALVKEIVELHNGSIRVNSKPGKGSEFVVRLPVEPGISRKEVTGGEPEPSAKPVNNLEMDPSDFVDDDPEGEPPGEAPVVLLVDDNPDILSYLRTKLLGRYRVISTESSKEALKLMKQEDIDLLISDVMMPPPDGFELCKLVKENPDLNHIPVILLTARAAEESRLEGLERGADDYISKPFSASELLVRVENLIELRRMLLEKFSQEVRIKGKKVEVTSEDARFLKQVQKVIEEHMENNNFGVDWLADEMNLSTRQLQRKIRAITNLSAGGYIRMLRLERARQLLEQHWGNVSEIAYKVGFLDAKYFSKLFKQTFGHTPTEFEDNEA